MFQSARLQLTLWYVLIISLITILFSVGVYRLLTQEIERSLRIQTLRLIEPGRGMRWYQEESPSFFVGKIIPESDVIPVYEDASTRLLYRIIGADILIIVVSAGAAYWLAGKTLRPIEAMIEEQKRFVSDASHELKTPLTSLRTEIEVALREKRMKSGEAKKILQSNLDDVKKMQKMTEYLLTLSKYQTDDQALHMEKISMQDVLQNALKKVQYKAQEKHITFSFSITDQKIKGNSTALEEVLIILLDNAIKYSGDATTIWIRTYAPKKYYIVEVEDQGLGIEKEDTEHIFERFYRSDKSRNKGIEGYGLGLSIAKQIIDLHHGKIEVESIPSKGSTFRIVLPAH